MLGHSNVANGLVSAQAVRAVAALLALAVSITRRNAQPATEEALECLWWHGEAGEGKRQAGQPSAGVVDRVDREDGALKVVAVLKQPWADDCTVDDRGEGVLRGGFWLRQLVLRIGANTCEMAEHFACAWNKGLKSGFGLQKRNKKRT